MSRILNTIGYSLKDVTIVPSKVSWIGSRKDVNCLNEEGHLPIFTAPMSCVVNEKNCKCFESVGIHSILPTTIDINVRIEKLKESNWVAMSMNEASDFFYNHIDELTSNGPTYRVCIDVANGHMMKLLSLCKGIKEKAVESSINLEIMTGNIANPYALMVMEDHGIDYVRVGIGGGSGCTTTSNTGCHYPMASLLEECYSIKVYNRAKIKIVADGGIRNYDDVNKALALGADYVMIGGLFTEMVEAASDEYDLSGNEAHVDVPKYDMSDEAEEKKREFINKAEYCHEVYGMSTKRAQKERGMTNLKTSEGTSHLKMIKYTLRQWTDNMKSYLSSAMSYCNSSKLSDFIGECDLIINSSSAISSVNK